MLFTTSSLAVLGFVSYASAHMTMATPKPYGNPSNSPLDASGSDFPCKNIAPDFSSATSMALGSTQPLAFTGGATHGGGSCQISITYDNPPTKNSVWKVIHSIEGGCPTRNNAGNIGTVAGAPDPDTYSFSMPANIPTGKAVLAWTWFNKVGNREMYMNCAAIGITGGTAKRSEEDELIARNETLLMERDQNAFSALPDMFVANVGNGCATVETKDLLFPNPGSSVDKPGANSVFGGPVGNCQAAVSGSSGSGSGSGSGSTPAASQSSSAAALPGGVFATVPVSSAAAATQAPVASSSPVAAAPAATATAAAPVAPAVSPAASPAASSAPASPASPVSGAQTPGSACSTEGEWNCISGNSFQRCASGTWSVVQQLATGTSCTAGMSAAIDIKASTQKRAIRFSAEHVRRHLHVRSS